MFLHGKPLYLKKNFAVRETWIDPAKLTTLPTNLLRFSERNPAGEVLGLDVESSCRLEDLMSQYKANEGAWNLVRGIEAAMVRRGGWISAFGGWSGGIRRTEIEAEDVLIRGWLKELKALVGVVEYKELEPKGVTWAGKVEDEGEILEKKVTTKDMAVFEGFVEVEKSREGDWLLVNQYGLNDESVRI